MPLSPTFLAQLRAGQPITIAELPFAAQAYATTELLAATRQPIVHVLPNDKDMEAMAALCRFLAPNAKILTLPAWDTLPYDRVSPSAAITAARITTLSRLATIEKSSPYILLTTVNAATQRLPPREMLARARFNIRKGGTLNRGALIQFLSNNGYQRVGKVMEAGEYAVRGSLMDVFPSGYEDGIRIDMMGEDIESLRRFDPLSQISGAEVDGLEFQPVSEVLLQSETIALFRTRYLALFGAATRDDPLYESISAGHTYAGMEHWLPLFYERLDTLAEYTPNAIVAFDHRCTALEAERDEAVADYYEARRMHQKKDSANYNPIPPEQLFMTRERFAFMWRERIQLTLTPFAVDGSLSLGTRPSPLLHTRVHDAGGHIRDILRDYIQHAEIPIILAANSLGSADRIAKMLGVEGTVSIADSRKALKRDTPLFTILPLEQGFASPEFILLTEQDMFGERIIRTAKKKRKSEAFLQEAASFAEGELIVHQEHGIGKFDGLVTVEVGTTKHDCLKLIYDGGDKLFLPVENIDLVTRYGTAEEHVALDKLGSLAWQKRKSGLKKRLKIAAEALIKVAAERAATTAPVLSAEAGVYDEFVARFPYTETDDQMQAIEEVRADLAAGHVMDRLVCGDVGFGKTEVAMRAAFIAASAGMQVALICPTTLLARQHFNNFSARFRDLPITIRMLSRLTNAKLASETKTLLAEGKVDIVIGTHALLSSSVQFKNLGLLVVDEEQHFGVGQKEKLKALKSNIHVLTLSATPIPRTLQLSLSGVRELSLITTPPVDRLAVRTYVMPYDPVVLREACMREYNRGGKIFCVTPRVKYMGELKEKLTQLVPELKIATAHGQLGAVALDGIMNEFYDGKYDVLLSTSIIESGIDIPTANTMIIDRADMFGLSQLYQLRGRVGRSKQRAYAYFTLPHVKKLSRDAERRLEVMQQLDTLGAGFQLASHDMDIRGFGNLLGDEQSGHIKEVGIELYQSMLEEAIADMKRRSLRDTRVEEEAQDSWSPTINLGMSVLIPESYIEDLPLRLSLYRRAAGLATSADLEGFAAELVDRFGTMPQEVEHLIATLGIKLLCKQAGIARLDVGPKGIVMAFRANKFAAPEALIGLIARNPQRIKLRADQTLFLSAESQSDAERLARATASATEIVALLPTTPAKAA